LYRSVSAFTGLVWLTVLWLVASLPLVTAPAATVALFRVARGGLDGITARGFFTAFTADLGRGTRAGGAWTLAGVVLLTDLWAAGRLPDPGRVPLTGLVLAAAVAYAAATPFLFGLLAERRFDGWAAIRLAVVTMAGNPGAAVRCLVVQAAGVTAVLLLWPLVLIVPAAGALVLVRLTEGLAGGGQWASRPTSSLS
jgi:uncharacterized membrane protein YesL